MVAAAARAHVRGMPRHPSIADRSLAAFSSLASASFARAVLLAAVLLAGCAGATSHGVLLGDPPRAPVPEEVDREELTFAGTDGVQLYAQRWRPRTGQVRGVLVIHHGLADHSARYAGFAEQLVRRGYAVWALDMRGHGRSAGRRVTFDRIDELVGDLERFVALVRTREPGAPVFVFGHSLGGLVTALYAIEKQPDVGGVVLSAPGIAFDMPAFSAGALRFTSAIAPNAPLLTVEHRDFSASAEVIADMKRDPLIEKPNGPARSARSAIDGIARVWAHPERLVAPLLAVHGTADKVTAPIGSRDLVARAGGADKTFRRYDDLNHDLLHEPAGGGDRVASDIAAWLDAHTGGPATGFEPLAPRRLRGDRAAMALAVDLDARGERTDAASGATAGLRLRAGFGRATPLGLGWTGGLDVRGGYLDGGLLEADAYPLGLALRARGGAQLAITAGIGLGGPRGIGATHLPIEAAVELPLGPVHVLARAQVGWRLGGDEYAGDAFGIADEAGGVLGLRLGRDRRYWATTAAGAGPFVAVTYRNLGGADVWGVALGGQMWGGN
jgi:alpha-beta hydrolase superfamily lysophospholipase